MRKTRPVNLNLFTIRFPATAISSILHRLSGVILFLFIAMMLWALSASLTSPTSFDQLHQTFTNSFTLRFFVWVCLSSLLYHFIAGVRHLIMDLGYGETIRGGRFSAYLVILLSIIFIIALGIRLW